MKRYLTLLIGILIILTADSVNAASTVIFSDNFDSELKGLNYSKFSNWTVSDGTVDLIGAGTAWNWSDLTSNVRYVDMDGSTGNAGKITTKLVFSLEPGNYTLSYDLAGNHRNISTDNVKVVLGNFNTNHSLNQNDKFQTFTNSFYVDSSTSVFLSFEGVGSDNDNIGMLLDNVVLSKTTTTPVPAAVWLLGSGLAGLVVTRRRSRK